MSASRVHAPPSPTASGGAPREDPSSALEMGTLVVPGGLAGPSSPRKTGGRSAPASPGRSRGASPPRSPRSRSAASSSSDIRLEELVRGERKYPFTSEAFRNFLAKQYCEENFDFLVEVDRRIKRKKSPAPGDALEVAETFLREASPREVNVSSDMRAQALKDLEAAAAVKDADKIRNAFQEPEKEIAKLLKSGNYVEKFVEAESGNIPDSIVNFRRRAGILTLLLTVGGLVAMVMLGVTRWYRALLFVPVLAGAFLLTESRECVCPLRAAAQVVQTGLGEDGKLGPEIKAEDPEFLRIIAVKLRRLTLQSVLSALIFTGGALAIPEL